MLDLFTVRVTGQKTGMNAHYFDAYFSFETKQDAEAFADFQIESSIMDPELENVNVEKRYEFHKKKSLTTRAK